MDERRPHHYVQADISKAHEPSGDLIVRNPKTGQSVTVRGAGALKGRLALNKAIDLTKPIASQAIKTRKTSTTKH